MWLLLLEACMAMFLLVFIVWWTMFHGRKPEQSTSQSSSAQKPALKSDDPAP